MNSANLRTWQFYHTVTLFVDAIHISPPSSSQRYSLRDIKAWTVERQRARAMMDTLCLEVGTCTAAAGFVLCTDEASHLFQCSTSASRVLASLCVCAPYLHCLLYSCETRERNGLWIDGSSNKLQKYPWTSYNCSSDFTPEIMRVHLCWIPPINFFCILGPQVVLFHTITDLI